MKFTPGKLAGMKAVSDSRGVIAAAAMDQRGSLQKSLGKEKGGEANEKDLEQFKIHVTEVLTQHANEMQRSNITYTEMFKMVKRKLAKEKGIVL